MRALLWPLAGLYGVVIFIRNYLFDKGFLKTTRVSAHVISVGNISAGGTGKTPLVAFIVKSLVQLGHNVAIVSRGYRGTYSNDGTLVNSESTESSTLFGDEPVMLSRMTKVPVYVGKKRVIAAQKAVLDGATTLVMDDGFQHRWLYRHLDIVVFDATEEQLQLLPVGRLREQLFYLKRANIVFISRARTVGVGDLGKTIDFLAEYGFSQSHKNLFFIDFKISNIVHVHTRARLTGADIFLLSAIGKPKNFEFTMSNMFSVKEHFIYPDHYNWSQGEWTDLIRKCKEAGGFPLVMTEKDAVKVRSLNSNDYPLFYTEMDVIMDKEFQLRNFVDSENRRS